MGLEPLFQKIDRLAGGRQAHLRITDEHRDNPRTRRAFTWVLWLLLLEFVIGLGAVVVALWLYREGQSVPFAVWMRTVVVLGMTATLFYFAWRARLGYYWGYSRLRLFSQIFPVITLVMAAIPHLYPAWMVTEQIIFSLIMIGVGDFLTSDHMRQAYRRPDAEVTGS